MVPPATSKSAPLALASETPGYDVRRPLLRSFTAVSAAFRDGSDTPRHFLERCLERIEQAEPVVQAFVCFDLERARQASDDASVRYRGNRALSPIDGMPLGLKDIIETRHMPTGMNSPIFDGYRPRRDAACVIALRKAGAVFLGKTVTTEFACGRSGPTRNPYDATRTPGGSSSGSAASVGAGMVPGALGTQTQASVIRPASYCGAYALKPSHNLLCYEGTAPLTPSMDTLGIFGADLDDVWGITAAIAAVAPGLGGPALRLDATSPAAVAPKRMARLDTVGWREVDDATRADFERVLGKLAAAGVEIVDRKTAADVEALEQLLLEVPDVSMRIFAYECQWPLRSYRECGEGLVGERVLELLALADSMSPQDYRDACDKRDILRQAVTALGAKADGFLTLSSSGPAIADIAYTGSRHYPVPWSLVAGPSVSLPLMVSSGLPVGLQVMGPYASDIAIMGRARWIRDLLIK
ncbi:MAG: amidase [Pseudolabrys sp.]|jgi:Asp-tRNA(Asn)/Glu-tRNA(Gln) amidotransferase A subunit family amidase